MIIIFYTVLQAKSNRRLFYGDKYGDKPREALKTDYHVIDVGRRCRRHQLRNLRVTTDTPILLSPEGSSKY
jgi:hypothetical protein